MIALKDLKQALSAFLRHDGPVMAGHLAFLSLLGLFPFLLFLVALAGFVGQTETGAKAVAFLFSNLPADVSRVLKGPVSNLLSQSRGGMLTFGVLAAIWVASSAIDAARHAIDRAYEAGNPPAFWLRRLQGLGLVILAATSILLGMSIFVLGPLLWQVVTYFLPFLEDWSVLANWVRLGASTLLFFAALCGLFFALKPRHKGRFVPVAPGALFTLILWLLVGSAFSVYLQYFGNYDVTYGSLAGAMIALVFFYLVGAAFILGAELNAVVARRRMEEIQAAARDTT
ncbi:MAG: YihY/virulence factor BrkB family protein [Alphaproteobacteria bacterium]|nr:MAG: YihY/virulence factor BrkB family protein [Alphaproteobacteria bacterium]